MFDAILYRIDQNESEENKVCKLQKFKQKSKRETESNPF
jgi:hypothetical protein